MELIGILKGERLYPRMCKGVLGLTGQGEAGRSGAQAAGAMGSGGQGKEWNGELWEEGKEHPCERTIPPRAPPPLRPACIKVQGVSPAS